jgi:hypothetical protein
MVEMPNLNRELKRVEPSVPHHSFAVLIELNASCRIAPSVYAANGLRFCRGSVAVLFCRGSVDVPFRCRQSTSRDADDDGQSNGGLGEHSRVSCLSSAHKRTGEHPAAFMSDLSEGLSNRVSSSGSKRT